MARIIPGITFKHLLPGKTGSIALIVISCLTMLYAWYAQPYKSNTCSGNCRDKDTIEKLKQTIRILRPIQTSTTWPPNRAENGSNHHISRERETTGTERETTGTAPTLNDGAKSSCKLCQEFDLSKNSTSSETFDCILMRFKPSVPICLYSTKRDIYVSRRLRKRGTWERRYVEKMQTWLRQDTNSGLIDLGANLGVYTLTAAAIGHQVLAVEPNIHNIVRLHRAAQQGQLETRITLLQNAISNVRGVAKIRYSTNNQGDTQIRMMSGQQNGTASKNVEVYTKTIIMNDLTEYCRFSKAIMKIDIQGFEHKAFQHAEELFKKVQIFKVLMEWEIMAPLASLNTSQNERKMVQGMIDFLTSHGYVPRDWNGQNLNLNTWKEWPKYVVWHLHETSLNKLL